MPGALIIAATRAELSGTDGLVCGVGPVEAAAATARALALRSFDAVLHVGVAGGREIPVGALVVGTEAVYCDLAAEWTVVDRAAPDARLVEAVTSTFPEATAVPIHTSATVGVTARNAALQGPLVEAMEGFGVLRAAEQAGVPAVEIRAISNEIGEPNRARWNLDGALSVLERAMPALLEAVEVATARES